MNDQFIYVDINVPIVYTFVYTCINMSKKVQDQKKL